MSGIFLALLFWAIVCVRTARSSYLLNDTDSCSSGELPCDNGQCIHWKSWCDGPLDCDDQSDESYCRIGNPDDPKAAASLNGCLRSLHFRCDNGLCIPLAGKCDDLPNCENREDEERCDFSYESSDEAETLAPTTTSTSTSTTAKPAAVSSWIPTRAEALRKALRHVIGARDGSWGWGRATPRAVAALALANGSYFHAHNHDGLLTRKQLEVTLALDLMRNASRPLGVSELSRHVQALLGAGLDPRDFHGVDVARLLRRAAAARRGRGLFVSPLAHLALCSAGLRPPSQEAQLLRRLKNMAYRRSEEQRWMDVQAYALLAISCMAESSATNVEEWKLLKTDVAKNITEWQQPDGSFGTLYSTALALQALIAAEEPGTESSKGRAMSLLLLRQGEWDEDCRYAALPALNMRSLASLRLATPPHDHGTQGTEGERRPAQKKKKVTVHYSLWIGGEKNEIHTLTLAVPRGFNFLQVMEAAQQLNPRYKHELLKTGRGSAVQSVAGRASDAEGATYWTLYRRVPLPFRPRLGDVTATVARLKLLGARRWTKDISKLHPKDGEHLAFWYKPYL